MMFVTARGAWSLPSALGLRPPCVSRPRRSGNEFSWLLSYRKHQLAPASLVATIDKLSVAFAIALAVIFRGGAK